MLEWFPQAAWVFQQHGFTMLKQPLLLRTLARGVTLGQAATVRGVEAELLLRDLNDAAGLALQDDRPLDRPWDSPSPADPRRPARSWR